MPPAAPATSAVAPNNPAPTTDYGTAYNEEGAIYDPQLSDVATEQQQLATQTQQSQAQLDQAKANAFTNDSLTANARGLMYSGYTPSTNTAYTTNTYNPAVTKLQTSNASSATTLQEKIDELNQNRANDAANLVSSTQTSNAEAAKTAAEAATKAATASKAAQPTTNDIAAAVTQNLAKASGSDGYVSPEDYAQAYIDWINNGQSASSFKSTFSRFENPNNGYYNYAITQAIKRS